MHRGFLLAIWLAALVSGLHLIAQSASLRQTYERARILDEKNSDLSEAIRLYGQVATQGKGERPLAARALYQKGVLHARIGQKQEAIRCWRQVITEYSDQTQLVRLARSKLNPTGSTLNGVTMRRVVEEEAFARVSPDGRLILFADSNSGNLALRDLATGEQRTLTSKKETWAQSKAQFLGGVFSTNGRNFAYQWLDHDPKPTVRTIRLDGTADRLIALCPEARFCQPIDWSADGKTLLVELTLEDNNFGLATLDIESARFTGIPLRRTLLGPALFAPKSTGIVATLMQDNGKGGDIFQVGLDGRETPLIAHPASDALVGITSSSSLLFSSDRLGATSLWMYDPVDRAEPVVVKQELGSVIPITLTRNGSLFYYSPTGLVDVFLAELDLVTGALASPPAALTQRSNGRNTFPSWSPDGKKLLFHSIPSPGPGKFVIYNRESKRFQEVSPSLLRAQRPIWAPDGRSIFVFGADSDGHQGHYIVDPDNGAATMVFPFSLTESPLEGAWSADGQYFFNRPNEWIQGIFRLEARTKQKKVLFAPPKGIDLGQENLAPSPDGRWLAFQAKGLPPNGSSLMLIPVDGGEARPLLSIREPERFAFGAFTWSPDSKLILAARGANQRYTLWIVPVDGSAPRRTALDYPSMRLPRLNPDGKTLSFSAGARWSEIWALEHFLPESNTR